MNLVNFFEPSRCNSYERFNAFCICSHPQITCMEGSMPFVAPENMAFTRLGQPKPPRNRRSPYFTVVHSNIPCPRKTFHLLRTPNKGRKNEEFACSQFMTHPAFCCVPDEAGNTSSHDFAQNHGRQDKNDIPDLSPDGLVRGDR